MTKEEAWEKYGDIPLKFEHYYKFSFRFCGIGPQGESIEASIGSTHEDIYRFECTPETTITLKKDDPYWVRITTKEGLELFKYLDL